MHHFLWKRKDNSEIRANIQEVEPRAEVNRSWNHSAMYQVFVSPQIHVLRSQSPLWWCLEMGLWEVIGFVCVLGCGGPIMGLVSL